MSSCSERTHDSVNQAAVVAPGKSVLSLICPGSQIPGGKCYARADQLGDSVTYVVWWPGLSVI